MAEKNPFRFGIFLKMSLIMVLVVAVPLVLVWYISYEASESAISQNVDNRLSSTADQLRNYVESWVDMNALVLLQNSELPDMMSMEGLRQKGALESIVKNYDWVYLAFSTDINGHNISRSDNKKLKDYSDRHYVRQVLGGQPMGQQVVISKTTGDPAVVISVPIKDKQDRIKGVLALGMSLVDISKRVSSTRLGKTGYAILLDQDGKVISHINEEYTKKRVNLTNHPGFDALMLGNKNSLIYTNGEGEKIFCHIRKTKHGWALIVEQDYDEAFNALRIYNQKTKILVLISLVVVLIIAFVFSRQITRPIQSLKIAMDSLSRGNAHLEIADTVRRDELGDLAKAMARLTRKVAVNKKRS
jgi:methyl-accepting chemotaxis protein